MPPAPATSADLDPSRKEYFQSKYDDRQALSYYEKHHAGIGRRISNWREMAMVRAALKRAGNPASVLDIPCGTGRFWPLLGETTGRKIFASDLNHPMLRTGLQFRGEQIVSRVKGFQSSVFRIPFRDNAVEAIVSIRLLHHFSDRADRLNILKEMARVSSRSVIVTLWVGGNWKARRLVKRNHREPARRSRDRFVVGRGEIESEFKQAGLSVVDCVHFLKFYSMWAAYVLRKD